MRILIIDDEPISSKPEPTKILIVEDDRISSRLMQNLLSPYGECEVAANGLEAMDAFHRACAENRPYDLSV